jgi:hypothetical protein
MGVMILSIAFAIVGAVVILFVGAVCLRLFLMALSA